MRMIGKAADRSLDRIIKGKVVEEQEGIKLVADFRRDRPAQFNAGALNRVLWLNNMRDFSGIVHEMNDDMCLREITGLMYNLRDSNRKRISIGICGDVRLEKFLLPQIRVRDQLGQRFSEHFTHKQSYNDSPVMANLRHAQTTSKEKFSQDSKKEITMNVAINRDVLVGKWKQFRGQAKQTWGKLTDNDLNQISGRFEELAGLVQEKYGYSREQAEREVQHFVEKVK